MEKSERQLEAIFIATPPSSPLSMALTRTTTPRNLPTMYHFDFGPATMESDTIEPQEENDAQDAMPQATLSTSPPIPEHGDASNLTPCPNCSRTFNLNALRKHVPICDKVTKKRNIFDSSRQRREGTELATYVLPKNFGLPNADKIAGVHTPAPVISRAPEATEQLVQSPLMARRKSQGNTELVRSTARASLRKAATPVEPATPSNAIMPAVDLTRSRKRSSDRSIAKRIKDVACDRCPHCDRTFNPKAFDRHVEWCKEKAIQATIKLANTNETSKAKERLDARKQYKPPNLKTKRSINRDKYSGSNEQTQQDFSEMVNNKPSLLSQSSLTSSGHSENQQRRNMMSNINRPGNFAAPYNSKTSVTQNTVSLHMTTDEPPKNARISSTRTSPKSKKHVVCDTIDDTMQRLRRRTNGENLKLVTPECVETALAQVDKKQPTKTNAKIAIIKELNLPPMKEQRFEKLNKLVNRKGETTVCRVQMDDADSFRLPVRTKERTSTSLTRQARRKVLTREHPSLEIRNNQKQEQNTHKLMPFNKLHYDAKNSNNSEFIQSPSSDFIHEPIEYAATKHHKMQRMLYGNSHDNISSNREIQIKLETNTTTSICRPKKRSNEFTHLGRIKPMRAMPMPQLSQCFGELVQTMGEDGNQEIGDHNDIDFDIDALHCKDYNLDTYDDGRVEDLACCDIELSKFDFSRVDDENEEELKPLRKHGSSNSSISRRLVVLEEDEDGVMYIKPASPQSNSGRGFSKRSISNLSNSGDSFKATCNSGNEKEKYYREKSLACNSSNDNKQTTESKCSDRHKGEIFISIETEPNALGDSPISPDSLRHMVGNEQTPIEMVEIKDGNEPEHSKFSKISDTDDVDAEVSDHVGDGPSKLALSATAAPTSRQDSKLEIDTLPNVQINNAKNLIQQMQSEFRQLGQDAGASMRKAMQLRTARSEVDFEKANEDDEAKKSPIQSTAQRGIGLSRTTPIGDSDELSSLDGYPISSSQSSRHGASSKLSSDSAYGSNSPSNLSRQRSIELSNTPRFQGISAPSSGLHCPRPHTTSGAVERKCTSVSPRTIPDVASQDYSDYATPKSRQQLFGVGSAVVGNNGNDTHESLSSGSENSLTMAAPQSNFNFQQQQSLSASQAASYNKSCTLDNKNNNISSVAVTPTTSQYSLLSNTSNSCMCSSMKMSKFCHECGAKFIIEHAKFCMECGVKRVIL